ncbi:MAG: colicin V production CvpA [Rhodobacterales bacterium RIFCSPHIGHO2_02_FULL_62_130]|jgi:membrane protein required for colicin V production|nr:MAG: colicin V production CvpA [Rhodobacterales bacterium RIFCSPHIGHO2_02_FULL_62_130]OHC60582.1 MAG: colicin V production CvpA [Rhodobacterales bacterium RIFCSPHIGHO2_12_FULL_62_75]
MEGFTLVDAGVAGIIVLSAILAYSRGFVREAMAIAGWVGAAFLAFLFAPSAQPLVKEIPVLGNFLGDSCELSIIAAFAAVFAIGLVLASLFTPLFSSVVQRSALGGLDQGLGFLFGVLRGIVLVGVAFLVYDRAVAANTVPMVDESRSAKIFASFQGNIDAAVPSDAPNWILSRYTDLTAACTADAKPAAEAAPSN